MCLAEYTISQYHEPLKTDRIPGLNVLLLDTNKRPFCYLLWHLTDPSFMTKYGTSLSPTHVPSSGISSTMKLMSILNAAKRWGNDLRLIWILRTLDWWNFLVNFAVSIVYSAGQTKPDTTNKIIGLVSFACNSYFLHKIRLPKKTDVMGMSQIVSYRSLVINV